MRMAKKKSKTTGNATVDGIIKKYGHVVESGIELLERLGNLKVIGISPALDLALGGGLREGTCVAMAGDPKTGKTTTALYFAAKAQAVGKNVYYVCSEGRVDRHNLEQIKGLDAEKVQIIQSSDDKTLSAEDYLNIIEKIIKEEEDVVVICDSTSSMCPRDELDGEIRANVRNGLPRLLAMFFKRIANDIQRTGAIAIFITHNIANTGGSRWAPAKVADSGNKLQYQISTNMAITHRGRWEDSDGKTIGQVANWVIKTSSAGGTPNTTCASYIRYGVGIDETRELAELANELALINKAGAWYTISCVLENVEDPAIKNWIETNEPDDVEKAFKFQGMAKLMKFLDDNEDIRNFVYDQLRDLVCV